MYCALAEALDREARLKPAPEKKLWQTLTTD